MIMIEDYPKVPMHVVEAFSRYKAEKIRPGSFLCAVIAGDIAARRCRPDVKVSDPHGEFYGRVEPWANAVLGGSEHMSCAEFHSHGSNPLNQGVNRFPVGVKIPRPPVAVSTV